MTSPRRQIVDSAVPGFYHCVSRCVRRAFLCGEDSYTGQNFEHRKAWVEQRLFELPRWFSIAVYAYAVMGNHLHVVLHVDPLAAMRWSPEEVASRWVGIFPCRTSGEVDELTCAERARAIAANPALVAVYRERLASLSWFMRCLCEPIARRANREDDCTGRFWEGRFKCQALLDDRALLACMTYVDLNPIRAGECETLVESTHTSVRHRLAECKASPRSQAQLQPVAGKPAVDMPPIRTNDYLALVDWTGRRVHPGKRGRIAESSPLALGRVVIDAGRWTANVLGIETDYWRAVGAVDALLAKARGMGQCWLKGLGAARGLES